MENLHDTIRNFSNGIQWELQSVTTIEQPPEREWSATMKYPSLIVLRHQTNSEKNGILIATGERWVEDYMCSVYRSLDDGATWELVTKLEDPFHQGVRTAFAPCIYELPVRVGEMPAGTLILGSDSINADWSECDIVLYRSYDQGETWEAFSIVAESQKKDDAFGVWEPNFACTDDGMLICYYSDDADRICSQKLVYKVTKDGVHWSEQVDTVALTQATHLRPGMPVVTPMGDDRYIMVYEIVGLPGNPVYCKVTDNPLEWENPTDMGTLICAGEKTLAATPWCAWSPVGGKNGMLVLTGWRMATGTSKTGSDIFVSFDCGNTWEAVPNYYSYTWESDDDTWGYSASICFSADGQTMYYMANPKGDREHTTWFQLFKIKVGKG